MVSLGELCRNGLRVSGRIPGQETTPSDPIGQTMTTNDGPPAHLDTNPFRVVASLGGVRMQITAGSVLAAAAAAEYWRGLGVTAVDWFLRDEYRHASPVLLFTRQAENGVVHATELMAGKPVSAHTVTCCGTPLHDKAMQLCASDMAQPCPACLAVIRSAELFSALGPQPPITVGDLIAV